MTSAHVGLLALIPAAYLAGSIPFGLIVGLSKGVDPRKAGSGNIGATNVGRLLGGKFFALVFTLDMLKGLLPTLAAGAILHFRAASAGENALWLTVGFATIVGHMFSLFLKFKGGKGVATSTGVILGVFPYYTCGAIAALTIWGLVFKFTRYVSLASMAGAVGFTITYFVLGLMLPAWDIFGKQWPLLGFAILVSLMIIVKHRGNLVRLRAGTENRIGKKAEQQI
jgi:glycerol-3-phosphate acyltransferase PlsY